MHMLNTLDQTVIKDNMLPSIANKALNAAQLQLIYNRQWFNIWVPKEYGGLELPLPVGCDLLETLAYEDGGMGWTVTLCSGANMFAGFLNPDMARQLFPERKVCWGGSGRIGGTAVKVPNGYRLTGEWKYATGAPHLTHFTLNAWLYDGEDPIYNEEGEPMYRSFFVDREDVLIHYDWDTFGLEVTASHSFSLSDVYVDENRAFELLPDKRTHDSALFRYPFMTFAACTLAVNYIGMFRKFLHLFEKQLFLKSKDETWAKEKGKERLRKFNDIEIPFLAMRDRLYELISFTWQENEKEKAQLEEIAMLSRDIVSFIRMNTVVLYPYMGIAGAQRNDEINIVFRNLFTASQHALLNI